MKLYTNPLSGNARKVEFMLRHLGVDAEMVVVDLGKGEQREPAFCKLNPNGKVPVLVDRDLVVWESHAIMRHLAREHAPELLGTDVRSRAAVDQWLSWQLAHLGATVSTLIGERMLEPMRGGTTDEAVVERAVAELGRLATILEDHLDGREWVAGDSLSIADIALSMSVAAAPFAKESFEGYAAIWAWFQRVSALDAWQDMPRLQR